MKSLYESILSSTNAGKTSIIKAWLDEYGIKNYTINNKGEIDVDGDVRLCKKDIRELPEYIQFGAVKGYFDCSSNELTTLKGSPKEVGRNFYCGYNNLISLDGALRIVKGLFDCSHNNLTSLRGCPKIVRGYFDCSYNNLESLDGAPKEVGGVFDCTNNSTKFTMDDVKKISNVGKKISV